MDRLTSLTARVRGCFQPLRDKYGRDAEFDCLSIYQYDQYSFTTSPIKPEDSRRIWGLMRRLADRGKLFSEYTYDQRRRIFPGTARPDSPSAFSTRPDGTTGTANTVIPGSTTTYTCNLAGFLTPPGLPSTWSSNPALSTLRYAHWRHAGAIELCGRYCRICHWTSRAAYGHRQLAARGYQEVNMPKLDWKVNNKNQASSFTTGCAGIRRAASKRGDQHLCG